MRKLGIALLPLALLAARADAQETAQTIVEKAIKAHGGTALMDRHPAARVRVKAVVNLGGVDLPAQVETLVQLPAQFKNVVQVEINGKKQTIVQVLNGNSGWMAIDGKAVALPDAELAQLKETFYAEQAARLTPLLRDKGYRLTALPETKIEGRPALGIKVAHAGWPDIYLSFDKASGLLIKCARRTKDVAQKEVLQEEIFRDYKELNGVKRPMKFVVLRNGKKFMESEVLEYTPLNKVDAKEFAKP